PRCEGRADGSLHSLPEDVEPVLSFDRIAAAQPTRTRGYGHCYTPSLGISVVSQFDGATRIPANVEATRSHGIGFLPLPRSCPPSKQSGVRGRDVRPGSSLEAASVHRVARDVLRCDGSTARTPAGRRAAARSAPPPRARWPRGPDVRR